MKIGIISDSHNCRRNVLKAVDVFGQRRVGYVFHAGDITSPATARIFAKLRGVKFIAVFGNCDHNKLSLQSTVDGFGGEIHEGAFSGQIEDKKIFMTHRPDTLADIVAAGRYDLVICGHTHRPDIHKVGNTLVINPGRSRYSWTGKSQVVVVDLDDMSTEEIVLE